MQTLRFHARSSTVIGVWRVHSATWPNQQYFGTGSKGGHGLGHSLAKSSSSSHLFSENSQRSRVTQVSTGAYNLGTLVRRLTCQEWAAFPRLVYQGTKKAVGTRNLMHTSPITCNFTKSQPLCSIYMTDEVSFLWAPPAKQPGCIGVIFPWASQGWDPLPMADLW